MVPQCTEPLPTTDSLVSWQAMPLVQSHSPVFPSLATHLLPLAYRVGCMCSRGFVAFPGVQGIQGQQHKLLWHREPSPGQLAVVILYGGDAGLAVKSKPKG